MKKYFAHYERTFIIEIEAKDILQAQGLAHTAIKEFPKGTCRLVGIKIDGYKEPPDAPAPTPIRPRGGPPKGGTPGAGTAKIEILVDQVAKAA